MNTKHAIIFTDGSSRGNPGPGGYGAIILIKEDKRVIEIGGGNPKTTNNRMELSAALFALEKSKEEEVAEALIYTDSSYLMKGMSAWMYGWQSNGWKTKDGGEVLNKDIWQKLLAVAQIVDVKFELIEGHAGIAGNERCDEIATSFADKKKIDLYDGLFENYSVDVSSTKSTGGVKKVKSDRAGKKAYSYISAVEGKVQVHKTWGECEARVKGKTGARFRKSLSREDEQEIIKSFS